MTVYLLNAYSVGLYAFVQFFIDGIRSNKMTGKRFRAVPGAANAFVFFLLILQSTLFLGLRMPSVGVDTARYVYVFQNFNFIDFDYEYGYMVFNFLLRLLTDNERVFLLLTASIATVPAGIMIYRYSERPFLSWYIYICLYYYSFNFSGIRQSMAASFLIIAFMLLLEKRSVFLSIIVVVVASLFHTSALVFLLAVVLRNHKWKKDDVVFLVLSYVIIFVFRTQIFNLITSIFYEDYEVVETDAYTWMLIHLVLLALIIYFKPYCDNDHIVDLSLTIFTVGCAFLLLTSVGTNVMRIANYFNVFIVLLIPNIMKVFERKTRLVLIIGGVMVLSYLYYAHLKNNPYDIIEYRYGWF